MLNEIKWENPVVKDYGKWGRNLILWTNLDGIEIYTQNKYYKLTGISK